MSETITFEGYVATISMDIEQGVLHGEVINTRDVLTFEAPDVPGLKAAFRDTINDYRAWCTEEGVLPEKPYSGAMSLRLPVETHRQAAVRAAQEGLSLNAWIVRTAECALGTRPVTLTQSDLEMRVANVRDDVLRVLGSRVLISEGVPLQPWENLPISSAKTRTMQ